MTTLIVPIRASSDDARELAGSVFTNQSSGNVDAVDEWFGWRFLQVDIPPGSLINSATLSVIPIDAANDEPKHTFYGELSLTPTTFDSGISSDISGRSRTSASVLWDNSNLGANGTLRFDSPDLKTIIQELINQSGWIYSKNIVLVCNGDADGARDLDLKTFDSSPSDSAILTIDFTSYGTGLTGFITEQPVFILSEEF